MTLRQHRDIVIGWGNSSRRDDAIGHHVVDALETTLPADAQPALVKVHQLDVTLAETVASHDLVVFVDACVESYANEPISVRPLAAEAARLCQPTSHDLSPAELLALTQWLYGRAPQAVLVTVTGHDFSFGEGLSVPARNAVPAAAHAVLELLSGRKKGPGVICAKHPEGRSGK